jgi:hypothetical protein
VRHELHPTITLIISSAIVACRVRLATLIEFHKSFFVTVFVVQELRKSPIKKILRMFIYVWLCIPESGVIVE